jgi:hypothetical protein
MATAVATIVATLAINHASCSHNIAPLITAHQLLANS